MYQNNTNAIIVKNILSGNLPAGTQAYTKSEILMSRFLPPTMPFYLEIDKALIVQVAFIIYCFKLTG